MPRSSPHPRGLSAEKIGSRSFYKFMPIAAPGRVAGDAQADNAALAVEVPRLVGLLRPWWPELKLPITELIDMNHISDYDLERLTLAR
jgi:hypothetical protein